MSTGIKYDGEKVRMGLVLGGFADGMIEQIAYHSFFDIDGAVKEVLRNIFLFYQNGDAGYLANATCLLL